MLWTIFIGFLVGLVAKMLMPGRDPGGFILTILLGISGSSMANWLGVKVEIYKDGDVAGFIGSVVGAMIVLLIYRLIFKTKTT
jgi:uncharacterized membrane protein YeaQ/YmgE (transglycosylase-associated protein family)